MPPIEVMTFLLGCALIIVAAIGGGMTAWNVRVPKLSTVPRILCAAIGACLILASVFGLLPGAGRSSPPLPRYCENIPPNNVPANAPAVEITDRLGDQQEFERVDIFVGGRLAGTLCVEEGRERHSIRIPLSGSKETWTATGSEARSLRGGRRLRSIQGSGAIDLSRAGTYAVRIEGDGSSDTVQTIWLRAN